MTRKGKKSQSGRPARTPQPAQRTRTANAYTVLAEEHDGEMNSHLAERFTGGLGGPSGPVDSDSCPRPDPRITAVNTALREYFKVTDKPVAGGNWLQKPEIPTAAEVLPERPSGNEKTVELAEDIRPNIVEGPYMSKEEYLRTHYEFLREDSIRPLRDVIEQVRASPCQDEAQYASGASIGLYEPVYVTSIVFAARGLAIRVAFSLGHVKKYVRWEQSKRLITGTLVALSPANDCFRSKIVLATVAARPISALNQNPPEIDLFFARAEDMDIDPMKKWIMVENRSSFYEANRHTMLALQHMMREPFPLSEHLVNAQTQVDPPEYVQRKPFTDMTTLVAMDEADSFRNINVLARDEWPKATSHGLDKSQAQALHRILTRRLAVIQGPPGTGKTYVTVVALKIMLNNMGPDDPPIIVTCQTNHAVDQLLRHVAEFEPNFIRLGGRSKDKDKVKKRTLFEVRMNLRTPGGGGARRNRGIAQCKTITGEMQKLLEPLEAKASALDYKLLLRYGLITPNQAQSLVMDSGCAMGISPDTPGIQMEQWLGRRLESCHRPLQPDDFGMDFEEEDFEVEELQELEAEAVAKDDDDIDALRGPVTLLSDNHTGKGEFKSDHEIREILRKYDDLTQVPVPARGAIYNYFQREIKLILGHSFREYAEKYSRVVNLRKQDKWEEDIMILRGQRLIGMTTTGLSKYRALIAGLQPKILVVEEAAETLEAPVTAACLPSLEHLILVGDHQQLRPRCQVREYEEEPYHFNLSLFERMVRNGVELGRLKRQRRMIPEIRRLLEPIYGSDLKDHPTVEDLGNRPAVEGMGGRNSFFFTHEWRETVDGNMSAMNQKEAEMIVGFFDYLVLNGVDSNNITVLTFYNGQRKLITKRLRSHPNLRTLPLNVVTVDSYQGEENDIVLLSLVRSNKKGNIGFLSVDNRVCVALSRAKRGFYLFGNAEMLATASKTWEKVVEIMYGKKGSSKIPKSRSVGYQFPLQCSNHQRRMYIEDPSDWEMINGGCDQQCHCPLACGHSCRRKCHPFSSDQINCYQPCNRKVPACGHACSQPCCDPCKCQRCDTSTNDVRAMLRPSGGVRTRQATPQPGGLQPPPPASAQTNNLLIDVLDQPSDESLSSDPTQARHTEVNTSAPGAAHSLIELSPVQRPVQSAIPDDFGLLIDVGSSAPASVAPRWIKYHETFTYGGEVSRVPETSLLD